MALTGVEFGIEVKKKYFHFKEDLLFSTTPPMESFLLTSGRSRNSKIEHVHVFIIKVM